jgi:hypothetical protein
MSFFKKCLFKWKSSSGKKEKREKAKKTKRKSKKDKKSKKKKKGKKGREAVARELSQEMSRVQQYHGTAQPPYPSAP